ncbi:hypothetical protein IKH83_02795 [Candidatus Saccharibacteria bacterium]|nr:hypothetical protein [Candidatus Saccharibacteria bacterium]
METGNAPKVQNKKGGFKAKRQRAHAKLLNTYYGKPIQDMKLVAVTGSTGKTIVAHYLHEILNAAGEQVAVFASDQPFKAATLHKFFNDAWKAGANYVIVTTPNESLRDNVFYGLPIHVAAMTNFVTSSLTDMTPEEFLDDEKTLFDMKPENVVLNYDDLNYETFKDFKGEKRTITYGHSSSDVKILSSKLYKKGTEATISTRGDIRTFATFVPGETAVSYMACAIAVSEILEISTEKILEGIANYEYNQ